MLRPAGLLVLALLGGAPTSLRAAEAGIDATAPVYTLHYPADRAARVEVRIELPEPLPAPRVLAFPRAVPLGYAEQPFDRFVSNVKVFGPGNGALNVKRLDGPRWQLGDSGRSVATIRYDVDVSWMENEIHSAAHSSRVRAGYAGFLGYTVFGYVEGLTDRPLRVSASGPAGWPVFGTLAPAEAPAAEPFDAVAADYETLADSQIVMGPTVKVLRREAAVPLYVVVFAQGKADADLIGQLGGQALNSVVEYFGEAPFPHYTILAEFVRAVSPQHAYGTTIAHLDSTTLVHTNEHAIGVDPGPGQVRAVVYDLARHIAQSWIPKRCSAAGARPFPWEFAPVLDTLWFDEGFPRYVAMVTVGGAMGSPLDALVTREFRDVLEESSPALRRLSTIDLSRVASTRGETDPRAALAVAARGGIMAAEMDALIRDRSARRSSLREGLRRVVARCRETGGSKLRADEIPALLQAGSGVDVRPVFDRWIGPQPEPRSP